MAEIVPDYRIASDLNLEKLEQILKNKPDDSSLLYALGELAMRRGRNLVALSAFMRLLDLDPNSAEVHLALAKVFAEQKMFEEAFLQIADAIEIDPGNLEARVLHDLLLPEAGPSTQAAARIKKRLKNSFDSQKVRIYLQRLGVEKDLLLNDQREISSRLNASPAEIFLEYSRAVVERKLAHIEQLFVKVEEITGMMPEKQKGADKPSSPKGKKREAPLED